MKKKKKSYFLFVLGYLDVKLFQDKSTITCIWREGTNEKQNKRKNINISFLRFFFSLQTLQWLIKAYLSNTITLKKIDIFFSSFLDQIQRNLLVFIFVVVYVWCYFFLFLMACYRNHVSPECISLIVHGFTTPNGTWAVKSWLFLTRFFCSTFSLVRLGQYPPPECWTWQKKSSIWKIRKTVHYTSDCLKLNFVWANGCR